MTKHELSDAKLIKEIQAGNEEAFTVLYERYVKLAHFIAFKLCKNDADCDDIVQDTFVQVKNKIDDLKKPELFKYWLNQIVISKCKNMFRKNKYITYQDEHYHTKNHLSETRIELLPEKIMNRLSDQEVMDQLINELPLGQREVVVLHYLQQFSVEETAQLLDLPVGTVKSRLSYARATLKQKVERYEHVSGVSLNFHSLDTLMLSVCSYGISSSIYSSIKPIPKIIEPTFFSGFITKALMIAAIATTTIGGGLAIKAYIDERNESSSIVSAQNIAEDQEHFSFTPIILKNKEIKTARIAYYTIKTWAHCEDELNHMNKEELQDVITLYESLKQDDSQYYHQLVNEGWTDALQQAIKKTR